jgi:hypothetical protein
MRAVWYVDSVKETHGTATHSLVNPEGDDYIFDHPPINVNENTDEDPSYMGGGINSFGIQIKNESVDHDITIRINWTGATIYVYDMDIYESHVAMVEEAMGLTPSANAVVMLAD